MSQWAVIAERHVVPLSDKREHITDVACWCGPTEDADSEHLWVHHSADGREAFEVPAGTLVQ